MSTRGTCPIGLIRFEDLQSIAQPACRKRRNGRIFSEHTHAHTNIDANRDCAMPGGRRWKTVGFICHFAIEKREKKTQPPHNCSEPNARSAQCIVPQSAETYVIHTPHADVSAMFYTCGCTQKKHTCCTHTIRYYY